MKNVGLFLSILTIQTHLTIAKTTEVTVAIETRIDLLKRELLEELQMENQSVTEHNDEYEDIYQYVDDSNRPITPINTFDKRKLKDRFKLPELKSTTTEKFIASESDSPEEVKKSRKKPLRAKQVKHTFKPETPPLDIFYRKMTFDDDVRNKPQKWTHCFDVLTPYLNGYKDNDTMIRRVNASSHDVRNLAHLLSLNVTGLSNNDIRSVLYEISKLRLKIFQWDVSAVRKILHVIIKNGTHDFKGLKYGLKGLFANWKLDLSDVGLFLRQSRIYRPPCLKISEDYNATTTTSFPTTTTEKTKVSTKETTSLN